MINPWRLAALGIGFLALFTMLTVRLWFLQVAAVEENVARASSNQKPFDSLPHLRRNPLGAT